jgi:hypothetical protein
VATSYKSGDKFFIDPMKLLPMERFLNADKKPAGGAFSLLPPPACTNPSFRRCRYPNPTSASGTLVVSEAPLRASSGARRLASSRNACRESPSRPQ